MEIQEMFGDFAAITPIIVIVAAFINSKLLIKEKYRQYTAWIVSIAYAFLGYWLQIGMFEGITIFQTVIYGIATALVSNGIFDIKAVKSFLKVIGLDKPKAVKNR